MIRNGVRDQIAIFEDEAGFSLHPKLGRIWCKRGTAYKSVVYTRSQHQQRVNVFGWVDPVFGRHGMIRCARGNTEGFLKVLLHLIRVWKNTTIHLWVDRARWHHGHHVKAFCKVHRQIRLRYIPAYHPELNYQEILWRTMRYEETTNTYFETLDDLSARVFKRSQRWRPNKVKSLCHHT